MRYCSVRCALVCSECQGEAEALCLQVIDFHSKHSGARVVAGIEVESVACMVDGALHSGRGSNVYSLLSLGRRLCRANVIRGSVLKKWRME